MSMQGFHSGEHLQHDPEDCTSEQALVFEKEIKIYECISLLVWVVRNTFTVPWIPNYSHLLLHETKVFGGLNTDIELVDKELLL